MRSRDSLEGSVVNAEKNTEKSVWRTVVLLEVEGGGLDREEEAEKVI